MEERQTIQRNGELWRTVRLPPVILAARSWHRLKKPSEARRAKPGGQAECELYAMQKLRYQQVVRSTMVLSLTELISRISLKKAFQK